MKNILGLLFGLGCILLVSCSGADVEVVSETPATEEETLVAVETEVETTEPVVEEEVTQ